MQPAWSNAHPRQQLPQNTGYGMMQGRPPVPYGASNAPPQAMFPQPTGFMQPQPTGYPVQQQIPMMTSNQTGMTNYPPSNSSSSQPMLGAFQNVPSQFMATFMPQSYQAQQSQQSYVAPPANLPQYFQDQNMQTMGQSQVQVQWALTNNEKQQYSRIFRAWADGNGFISGNKAIGILNESGLPREELEKVWALADTQNRGKLDLAEFEVAMGLLYRRLSGNPIPNVLPQEMVPPSSRDIEQSVDFLKDLLRNDTNSRSTNLNTPLNSQDNKYAKVRSFNRDASPEPSSGSRKDAMVYRHDDADVKTYKSSSRHLDRRNVRFHGDDESSELGDIKKQLQSTQELLDRTYKDDDDDDDLQGEVDELKYRIRRVQEDIEFNKSGRRTEGKDNERRRLERELLFLMHEKLPELEEKMQKKERKQRSQNRATASRRDARNNSTKYSRQSDSSDDDAEAEQPDRGYLRGSYNAARDTARESSSKEQPRGNYDAKPSSRVNPSVHDPAPAPPARLSSSNVPKSPPPPPPILSSTPAVASSFTSHSNTPDSAAHSKKPQTAEERQAYIRAEAQRRVQERMRMLTGQSPVVSPVPSEPLPSGYDTSLQVRLEQDKKEAARRAEEDDKAAAERERLRQIKLEEERQNQLQREERNVKDTTRALQQVSNELTASEVRHAGSGADAVSQAAREELVHEERLVKQKEQAILEQQKANQARLDSLKSGAPHKGKAAPPPPAPRVAKAAPPKPPPSRKIVSPAPASVSVPSSPAALPTASASDTSTPARNGTSNEDLTGPAALSLSQHAPPPPAAPPAPTPPPAAASSPAANKISSTNPFHRLAGQSPAATPASSAPKGANNPFFRPPTGASTVAAAPPLQQPAAIKPPARKEDDWGDSNNGKADESDDSDEEAGPSVKQKRAGLAGLLFGGSPSNPPSRPGSARPDSPASAATSKAPAAPALPPLGAAAGAPPPRAALLGAIQSGARLRHTQTIDKSIVQGAGSVIGDSQETPLHSALSDTEHRTGKQSLSAGTPDDPPSASAAAPEPAQPSATAVGRNNRQSVDWYGGLAADSYPSPTIPDSAAKLANVAEEASDSSEEESPANTSNVVANHGDEAGNASVDSPDDDDPAVDFDMSSSTKVRSLYAYAGQRPQDATFDSNLLIIAHPPKDPSSDWYYGIVPATGSRGWLPKTYVQELAFNTPARVLYDFEGSSEDEMSTQAGSHVFIGEKIDSDWARVVLNGRIGLVPLAYLEEESQ